MIVHIHWGGCQQQGCHTWVISYPRYWVPSRDPMGTVFIVLVRLYSQCQGGWTLHHQHNQFFPLTGHLQKKTSKKKKDTDLMYGMASVLWIQCSTNGILLQIRWLKCRRSKSTFSLSQRLQGMSLVQSQYTAGTECHLSQLPFWHGKHSVFSESQTNILFSLPGCTSNAQMARWVYLKESCS